jgi:hypothetical protein
MVRSVVGSLLETRRVMVAVLALGLLAMSARRMTDPDVWWHLRTGELILQNHGLFHTDPYSFTKFGQPWMNHEWVSDIFIFGVYRATGWGGLIVAFGIIITAAFLLLFQRCSGRPYLAALLTAWGAISSSSTWGVRPQMFSLLLTSLFLVILERSDERASVLWWTPPLMLLWVNLHAGFPVGLGLMVLFLGGRLLEVVFGAEPWSQAYPKMRRLLFFLGLCLAIVPLNPYGMRMYAYPLETIRSRAMQSYIQEWHSPNFHEIAYLPLLLMILTILAAAILSPRRLSARELLLLVITTWAALHSIRHMPLYVMVAVPILGAQLHAWWRESHTAQATRIPPKLAAPFTLWVNAALLLGFLAWTLTWIHSVIAKQHDTEATSFPAAAVSFIDTTHPPGPILNHYNWGGYFIWRLYPQYLVYIDGRADLYGDSFMDENSALYSLSIPSWQQSLERWHIRTVVLPPDAPLLAALRQNVGWRQIYADSQAVVFTRRDSDQ